MCINMATLILCAIAQHAFLCVLVLCPAVGSCWYVSCNDSTISGPSNCTTLVSVAIESCRNHSGPPDECFWNQYSRLTGVYCEECEKLCRSERTSLNFVQLLIGLAVFSPAFPYCRITMSILASDAMGKEGQVCCGSSFSLLSHVCMFIYVTYRQQEICSFIFLPPVYHSCVSILSPMCFAQYGEVYANQIYVLNLLDHFWYNSIGVNRSCQRGLQPCKDHAGVISLT